MLPAAPGSVPDVERPVIRYCLTAGISVCLYLPQVSGAGVHGTLDLAIRQVEKDRAAEERAAWQAKWPLGYNPAASVVMLPVAPLAPTSVEACTGYREKTRAMIQDVVMHHQACLDATSSTRRPYSWTDATHTDCSNPKCDSLHQAMYRLGGKADAAYDKCMEAVRRHQTREAERGESRLR